jgi:hypothetical protein
MGSEWILGRLAGDVDWIRQAQERDRWRAVVSAVMNVRVLEPRSWLASLKRFCSGHIIYHTQHCTVYSVLHCYAQHSDHCKLVTSHVAREPVAA